MQIPLVSNAPLPSDPRSVNPQPTMPRLHVKPADVMFGVPELPLTSVQVVITLKVAILAPADAVVDVVIALLVVVAVELFAVLDAALDPDIPQSSTKEVRQASESWAHHLARCTGECRLVEE
ncbi:unnamed protein product [Phytophthora fragariaefolia]|uniref:Unnamed protein product n=1 Tax=Phytophthora fragariaefolia TaxID=1490495 RepID=A0A9W6XFZ7_9STRA|nr:unnamed protein product [Phytophthora fragariaefolia]